MKFSPYSIKCFWLYLNVFEIQANRDKQNDTTHIKYNNYGIIDTFWQISAFLIVCMRVYQSKENHAACESKLAELADLDDVNQYAHNQEYLKLQCQMCR